MRFQNCALLVARPKRVVGIQRRSRHCESCEIVAHIRAREGIDEASTVGFARCIDAVLIDTEVVFQVCEQVGYELDVIDIGTGVGGSFPRRALATVQALGVDYDVVGGCGVILVKRCVALYVRAAATAMLRGN